MKDVMSSVDIAAITLELADTILDQRIDNVYHIMPKTFIIRLRPKDRRLLIEPEKRIHLTQFNYPIPSKPSNFCMTLRKHLSGGIMKSIEQYEFERIIHLVISTHEGDYTLVAEIFRRGNLILVDPRNKVLLSLRYARMRDRNVIRNELYQPAPLSGMNPLTMNLNVIREIKNAGEIPLSKALTSMLSIGPLYCKEIMALAGQVEKSVKRLTPTDIDQITESISKIKKLLLNKEFEPIIVYDENNLPLDVIPFPLKIHENKSLKRFKTYNEAADEFFSAQASRTEIDKAHLAQEEEISKLKRILDEQKEQKQLLKNAIDKNKKKGDNIFLNLHTISELLQTIRLRKNNGITLKEINILANEQISKINPEFHVEILSEELRLMIDGETIQIRQDKTPQGVAEEYYSAAKKASQKLKGLEISVRNIESRLTSPTIKDMFDKAQTKMPTRIKEKVWYEKFHWFRSSDDLLVLSGKDASSNESLIKRYLDKGDIVFHAEIHGAPFTIIKTEGRSVPETTLIEAAQAAASRSKAWSLDLASLDVYWVNADQVGTQVPSGEYLGRGQFMITGKRNYLRGIPLKMAIGLKEEEKGISVIAGPSSAINKQSQVNIEIVPGNTSSGKLAKKIIEMLKATSSENMKQKLILIRLDEVARLIPSGKGDILSRGKRAPQIL